MNDFSEISKYSKLFVYWDSNQNRIRLLISKVNVKNYEYLGDISMKKVNPKDRYNYIQKNVLKYKKLKNIDSDFQYEL